MRSTARLVVGALATVATLAVAAPVGAAPTAGLDQCTTTRGTIVAVDFGHWGGPVVRGCGVQSNGQPDASGYVLLHDGGFTSAGTSRDGPAFICRLGSASFNGGTQYPTAAEDACNVTPPESAYWSFWLAPSGASSWQHSDYGATSDHPVAGEVELWTFGGTNTAGTNTAGTSGTGVPSSSLINQLRAHNTTPVGGAPATTSRGSASGPGGGSARGSTAASTRGTSVSTSPDAPATPTTTTGPAAGTNTSSDGPAIVAARSTPTSHHDSGSVLPVVITVIILAVLLGLGGLSLLRRRRADGD